MIPEQIESRSTKALQDVLRERIRQDAKWGEQNHTPDIWLTILVEEIGEVAKAMLEKTSGRGDMREEVIHVAAVALAWIECMDRTQRVADGRADRG